MRAERDRFVGFGMDDLFDGNGEFTRRMGLLVDKSAIGLGDRSWRYAMVVDDGVIEKLFLEAEGTGDPYGVSDADTVLGWLGGKADPDVLLFTKPGCAPCARAKDALAAAGLPYAELRVLVDEARPTDALFRTNHASNDLPLAGRLPHDRNPLVAVIDAALAGRVALRPERVR